MLLQSHEGVVSLIPAVPAAWKNGSFRGLRARGGFTISAEWQDSEITDVVISPDAPSHVVLELPEKQTEVTFMDEKGKKHVAENHLIRLDISCPICLKRQ